MEGLRFSSSSSGGASPSAPALPSYRVSVQPRLPYGPFVAGVPPSRGLDQWIALPGLRLGTRWFRFDLAPDIVVRTNLRFALDDASSGGVPPIQLPFRNTASPWNVSSAVRQRYPVDLPWITGNNRQLLASVSPGASGVWVTLGAIEAGLSTEPEWWGPGRHASLVLSTSAPGIPRLAVRSQRGLDIVGGTLNFSSAVGELRESGWFDTLTANDRRSWVGLSVSYRPHAAPSVEVGLSRAVYGGLPPASSAASRVLDVVRPVRDPARGFAFDSGGAPDARDQVASIWTRWVPPASGLEVYGEIGRTVLPTSVRDALVDPFHSAAFVVGLQHVTPVESGGAWRVALELATTEQSPSYRWRPLGSWGTSRAVAQGYTHLGRPLGLAIGPGTSGQWGQVERWFTDGTGLGVFASRRRWNADAMLAMPWNTAGGQGYCEFDTGIAAGAFVAKPAGPGLMTMRVSGLRRVNVFMQNRAGCGAVAPAARDVSDLNVEFAWTPQRVRRIEPASRPLTSRIGTVRPMSLVVRPDDARRERDVALFAAAVAVPPGVVLRDFVPLGTGVASWSAALGDAGMRWQSTRPLAMGVNGIWTGRGLTAWVMPMLSYNSRHVRMVLAPLAFGTQDLSFPLQPTGRTGVAGFANGQYPTAIDAPQRFRDGGYARLSGGQSAAFVRGLGHQVGVTTATARWGPGEFFPYLRSATAEGYPRVQVGTDAGAVATWVGSIEWRVEWGVLSSSRVFGAADSVSPPRRFGTGAVVAWTPRFASRLTVGAARFFHIPFASGPIQRRWIGRVFDGVLKRSLPVLPDGLPGDDRTRDGENQLASVFARLGTGAGVEVYAEIGREDYSWDARDLLVAPLQQGSLMAGVARTSSAGRALRTFRAEAIVFPGWSADRNRGVPGGFLSPATYLHRAGAPQGHTHRGLLLGAPVGVGAASGQTVYVAEHNQGSNWEVQASRVVRQTQEFAVLPQAPQLRALEVDYTLQGERSLARFPFRIGGSATWTFNRALAGDGVNLALWVRIRP
jgi:hypothetical protein